MQIGKDYEKNRYFLVYFGVGSGKYMKINISFASKTLKSKPFLDIFSPHNKISETYAVYYLKYSKSTINGLLDYLHILSGFKKRRYHDSERLLNGFCRSTDLEKIMEHFYGEANSCFPRSVSVI